MSAPADGAGAPARGVTLSSPLHKAVICRAHQEGASFPVLNPATGEHLADVSDMGPQEVDDAVARAKKAMVTWSRKTAKERAAVLMVWHGLIMRHQEELAELLTLEMGKPLAEARGEVAHGASYIVWFAEEAKRLYGDIIPTNDQNRRLLVIKQPVGVVAAITPWNFPSAMITRKIAPALAAGCTAVVKPAEDTPLSAIALAILAEEAGFPEGAVNVITCKNPADVAKALTDHEDVRKLSFTGSTRVGKLLMRQCADTVKKISLELGGNAPFIVFDDADIEAAVAGAMMAKYRNAGQTCISANRFYVQAGVREEFAMKLAEAVSRLKMGSGADVGTTVGPLINPGAVAKVDGLVRGACASGATVVLGGKPGAMGGNFYEPTVLADVKPEMAISQNEIFGPVAAIYPFEEETDAIAMANDTPYGLAAYVYTRDMGRIWRVSEALEYGMVGINDGTFSSEAAPFGGVKQSGIGREGSKYGLDDFVEIKYISMAGLS